jgi:sn-glycerol 3-phosphate transport system permease protein
MEGRFPNRVLPYLLLLPSIAIVLVFLILPAAQALYLSFFHVAPFTGTSVYVGFQNFADLFAADDYRRSLWISLVFASTVVILGLAVSLATALLANQRARGIGIFRTAVLWPYALSPAVAGTIWALLFDPSSGLMTFLIRETTGLSPNWMMDPGYALAVTIVAAAWKMLGFNVVFFLAGLQAVPQEVLEAGRVDGAGPAQEFWRLTFPILSPVSLFLLVMNSLYAFFEVFGLIDVMTQGGPGGGTEVLIYKLYQDGFVAIRWGQASAQSIVLFVLVSALTLLQFRVAGRRVFYG